MIETILLITKLISLIVQALTLLSRGISALKLVKGKRICTQIRSRYVRLPLTKRKGKG
jgi:hypothetical protein